LEDKIEQSSDSKDDEYQRALIEKGFIICGADGKISNEYQSLVTKYKLVTIDHKDPSPYLRNMNVVWTYINADDS
jgi:hypothetical protein